MDYKLEYMERLFAKIGKKKTEAYVISRIWHQLDDDRVKFVVQQYIRRTQEYIAISFISCHRTENDFPNTLLCV